MSPSPLRTALVGLGLLLAACGGSAPPSASAPGAAAPVKIGFLLGTEQEERYQRDKAAFLEAAASLGAEVVFLSANNEEGAQAANVEAALAQGVQVLVVQPVNSDNAGVFVEKAHAKGVPVIAYDRMINHRDLDLYAGQNSAEVGRLQAEAAVRWMKSHGGIGPAAILSGQQGHSVAEAITAAARAGLESEGVPIALQQYHDAWGTDQALRTVENALVAHPDLKAVLCNNSGMARGAVQAVEKAGRAGRVFLTGADADRANVEYLVEGKQQQEIYKDEIALAAAAARLAVGLARGERPTPNAPPTTYKDAVNVPTVLTPVREVTAENYRAVVVEAGPRYPL